jgi:hypothetical protein
MPQLRPHGNLASKRFRTPRPMAFCRCSECIAYQHVDAQAREVMAGSMITLDQFKEHQKREIIKQAALQRLEATLPLPENKDTDTADFPRLPESMAKCTTRTPRNTKKRKTQDSSSPSTFYTMLSSFRTRLQVRPVATFFKEQCILFSNPPTRVSSKVQGYLDLDVGAPQNQAILIHERWLRDGVRRVQHQLDSTKYQTSSHERLLAAIVIRNIRRALEQLEIFKAEEWERQYKLAKERTAPVIDTSKD